MANLSNINNILRTGSLGVGINRDPLGAFEISSATKPGVKMFNTSTNGKTYEAYSDTNGNYIIYDQDADDNRFVINTSGNATFAGSITTPSILANSFMEIRSDAASFYFENAANNNYYRLKRSSNNFVIDYYNGTTTSDRLTIDSSGNATFAGDLIQSSASKSLKYWRRLWADANNDWGLNNNAGSAVISVSGMGTPSTSSTTFAGNVTANVGTFNSDSGGTALKLIGRSAANSGALRYYQNNGTTQTARIESNDSIFEINSISNLPIQLKTNDTLALTIDTSQNATFAKNISVTDGTLTLNKSDGSLVKFVYNNTTRGYIGSSRQLFVGGLEADMGYLATGDSVFGAGGAERMRITSDGYLNAGGYTTASNTHHKIVTTRTNSETLRVENNSATPYGQIIRHGSAAPNTTDNWFLVCEDNAFSRLIIWSNGNVINRNNSYGGYSDIKLKENIVDATPKLDDLMKVKIRNYNLIGDDKKQIGVVAQELEEVFPGMIDESKIPDSEDETLYKGVKYSVFVPILIKAIQELKADNDSLKARIETLENN